MKRLPKGKPAQIMGSRGFQTMYTAEQMRKAVADEREACAKICDEWHQACCKFETQKRTHHYIMGKGAAQCAHSIRARGWPEQEPVKRTVMYRPADLESLGLTHEDVVKLIKEQS